MIDGINMHTGPQQNIVAYDNFMTVQHHTVKVCVEILADRYLNAVMHWLAQYAVPKRLNKRVMCFKLPARVPYISTCQARCVTHLAQLFIQAVKRLTAIIFPILSLQLCLPETYMRNHQHIKPIQSSRIKPLGY